ncbi:MAG TPA: acyl-CoA--6-aminopenicillanic acid acyl-transferase, partial [Flavobacterium sp.]
KRAIIIEVSPDNLGIYEVQNSNALLCSNHFQSDALKNDSRNIDQIENSHSKYRYDRFVELMSKTPNVGAIEAAAILRNKEGLNEIPLGYGNEKALNQLLAHHGIIFKPEDLLVWVSANPYQMGEFVCYDLNKVFNNPHSSQSLQETNLNIPKDPFIETQAYENYEAYRVEDRKMDVFIENNSGLTPDFVKKYQSLNSDFWIVYYKAGLYYYKQKNYAAARSEFEKTLSKEITTLPAKERIEKYLRKIKRKE